MDPVLHLPPLPMHDPAPVTPVPASVVATWPTGTFLENLVVLDDRSIVVSVLSEARLDLVSPNGSVEVLHEFDAPVSGLAEANGRLFVAVGEAGAGQPALWMVDVPTRVAIPWMDLQDVAFANGVTPFAPGELLIADSWSGILWHVDVAQRQTRAWLQDERLTRAPGVDFLPGANGVKRFGDEVTVSSNGRALLLRAAVLADGRAGALELVADHLRVDDFAYDRAGRLYLTTHIGHSLDRLDRDGRRIGLGGVAQGLAGSTACAFGHGAGDARALFVTTTGGLLAPPNGILEPARLVRLEVDAIGHPLDRAWETER